MWDVVSDVVRDRLMLMGTLMSARPRYVKLGFSSFISLVELFHTTSKTSHLLRHSYPLDLKFSSEMLRGTGHW